MAKTDNSHILAALREDPDLGMRLFIESYGQRLYWHIRRMIPCHSDADDVMQETLVRIYRNVAKIEKSESLLTWSYRIATNEALRFTSRNPHSEILPDATENIPEEEYIDYSDIEAVQLQRAIKSLPRKQQLAFTLRHYDELSYAEIAHILGGSAAAAKVNFSIAKQKIIKLLSE